MHKLAHFILSYISHMLLSFLFFFFFNLSFCCPDWVISIILSSRSLIPSSVLFSLLFIASRLVFISAICLFLIGFDWFTFMVSGSLLQ